MSTPRFLADEDFRYEIVEAARQFCPSLDLITVQEARLESTSDADLLEFAAANNRIVISHDVNTMTDAAIDRIESSLFLPGLFVAPQNCAIRPVAECIQLVAEASQAEEWHSLIVYLPF